MIYLIQLSESDKRILISLLLVLILLFVLVGYLVKFIKYLLKVQGDYVEKSMYDILDADLITDKKHFFKVSWEKNTRKFYFSARLPVIILICLLAIVLIYQTVIEDYSWDFFAFYLKEASFKLDWPTQEFFGLQIISDWPSIAKASVFYFDKFDAWLTYLVTLTGAYAIIHFLLCSISLLARNIRTIKVGNEYFKKDLDELKKAKLNARQAHIKKPTDELKEYVKEEGTK